MVNRNSPWAIRWRSILVAIGFAVVLSFAGFAIEARADPLPPAPEIDKIRGVISAQMEAFKHDDAVLAFSFATPGIQEMMGTPEQFLALVRAQYLPVYRSKKVVFRDPVKLADRPGIVQPAVVTGPDDMPVFALYTVEQQVDGAWRISGCLLYKLVPGGGTST